MTESNAAQSLELTRELAALDNQELLQRLQQMQTENEALAQELLRCYEQLNLVFEITEHIATLQDPEAIQRRLLQRFGTAIGAGAVYLDQDGRCVPIALPDGPTCGVHLAAEQIQACLAKEIELVRQTQRAQVPTCDESVRQALDGAHVLVLPLRQQNAETGVIVVLRDRAKPVFDSGDMLASESVLGYGGQVVSNLLMVRDLERMAFETVRALANAIDAKDNYTCGHSERVGWLARQTGAALGLPDAKLDLLEWAGILHDVGKIGISEEILNKPGKLTAAEYEEMKRHPHMSYEVLKPVARLGPVLDGVLFHHENWDGSGYPNGLRGEQIPLSARIIRIVDVFDALTSTRSYRQGFSIERAFAILREEIGRGTDPHVTGVFIELFQRYVAEEPAEFQQRFSHIAMEPSEQPTAPEPVTNASGAMKDVSSVPAPGKGGELP